jgi:hypothetical protein
VAEYYTLDSVRNFVTQNRWKVSSVYPTRELEEEMYGQYRAVDIKDKFPDNWHFCPCRIKEICITRKKRCIIRIGISTDNPLDTSLFIEIIYLANDEIGIIRPEQMLFNKYINENNVVGLEDLETINL